jgi:hypothetical protein
MESWAGSLRGLALAKFHNEELVDESLQNWIVRFALMGGWTHMKEGLSLSQAKSYVFTGLKNDILNHIRSQNLHQDRSLQETDDEGNSSFDPADPSADKQFDLTELKSERMAPWNQPKVKRVLEKAHPDAPLFLDLLMDGHTQKSIIQQGMLPHFDSSYQYWMDKVKPKIMDTINHLHITDVAMAYLDRHLNA